jgi:hypothetical protein
VVHQPGHHQNECRLGMEGRRSGDQGDSEIAPLELSCERPEIDYSIDYIQKFKRRKSIKYLILINQSTAQSEFISLNHESFSSNLGQPKLPILRLFVPLKEMIRQAIKIMTKRDPPVINFDLLMQTKVSRREIQLRIHNGSNLNKSN